MVRVSTVMRRVLKSKARVDLRIIRMLKNKFGSNESVSQIVPLAHQADKKSALQELFEQKQFNIPVDLDVSQIY